jgi:hypothetical protein
MNSIATTQTRLPGIRFRVKPRPSGETLPRMDIAAFIGFAAAGPFDFPVPVEDMAGFREHFGNDLPLALDPATGQVHYACLASAVEHFFKNGGKRCWVVRVDHNADNRDENNNFPAGFFLDPALADTPVRSLVPEANSRYFMREKFPKGIHRLLCLKEVTLAAIPDAVHTGWESLDKSPLQPLEAPELRFNVPMLQWDPAPEALYTLQESVDPLFNEAVITYSGTLTQLPLDPGSGCPRKRFYRVNARAGERLSPWSNTLEIVLPYEDFNRCTPQDTGAPQLELHDVDSPPGNRYELSWNGGEDQGQDIRYILEQSHSPGFDSSVLVYKGPLTSSPFNRSDTDPRTYYFRVRRVIDEDGVVTPWSNTRILPNPRFNRRWMKAADDYQGEELARLHRALLRFCAARGDVSALLSLPRHYREDGITAHVKLLTGSGGDNDILSFGALYHPWILSAVPSGGGETFRWIPPDGAVCGAFAARALRRGAWVAPANQPLKDVLALSDTIDMNGWQTLFDNQVNVIREDPRGFMVMSAMTLSPDAALKAVNVRRLLILLRRLALREGMNYVFQPNTGDFRRSVQRGFEHLLARMYALGAFAGDSPQTSFQVVTGPSVNTPPSLEQGRFIVELKVAPSRPMSFIVVRLVQTHDEGLSILEI